MLRSFLTYLSLYSLAIHDVNLSFRSFQMKHFGALIIDMQLSGLGAAWKVANISEGSKVVIFGLGTVGLSVSALIQAEDLA